MTKRRIALAAFVAAVAVAVAALLFHRRIEQWRRPCSAMTEAELQALAQHAIAADLQGRFPKAKIVVGKLPITILLATEPGTAAQFAFDIQAPMRETYASAQVSAACTVEVSYSARIEPRL